MREKMNQRRENMRKKQEEEDQARRKKESSQNPYDLMGEGIANEIMGNNNSGNVINYPSGFGANMFAGGGEGGLSEAEQLEAAIQASLKEMSLAEGENKKPE